MTIGVSIVGYETAKTLPLPPRQGRPIVIIQARMGSTRLPGKAMADLGGKPAIERLLERVGRSVAVGKVVVATTVLPRDDVLAEVATRAGAGVFRGDERDVVGRFRAAAEVEGADCLVRLTADCPLLDPVVVDAVVAAWWNGGDPYQFGGNTIERTFPDGMDVEVMTMETLCDLDRTAEGIDREHVTSLLVRDPTPWECTNVSLPKFLAEVRFTLDTENDLAKLRWLWREAKEIDPEVSLESLLHVEGWPL